MSNPGDDDSRLFREAVRGAKTLRAEPRAGQRKRRGKAKHPAASGADRPAGGQQGRFSTQEHNSFRQREFPSVTGTRPSAANWPGKRELLGEKEKAYPAG